jgi:hypothetical protein
MRQPKWVLKCRECDWIPAGDIPMGLVKAHVDIEHEGREVALDLVAKCPFCDEIMDIFSQHGKKIEYRHCGRQFRVVTR